jgi:hypothetical protein
LKYFTLNGGLGNQMFVYALCEEFRYRGQKSVLFIQHHTNLKKYGHQGYELEKLFSIKKYDGIYSIITTFFLVYYSQFLRLFPVKYRKKLYRLIGIHTRTVKENFIFYPEIFKPESENELFKGTWQSELFFINVNERVRKAFVFRESLLSLETKDIAQKMQQEISVSIHIRRGDYLSTQYFSGFSGICTLEYYKNAAQIILDKHKNVRFYVFTDDPEWVNKNFTLKDAVYIQHNSGSDSWQDMYLMSRCKHNIIANSSFSWWGAWLNTNPNKIVIAPKKWWNGFEHDDVVPEGWIRL